MLGSGQKLAITHHCSCRAPVPAITSMGILQEERKLSVLLHRQEGDLC